MNSASLKYFLTGTFSRPVRRVASHALYSDSLRPLLLRLVRNRIQAILRDRDMPANQRRIIRDRRLISLAGIGAVEKAVARRTVSRQVLDRVGDLWSRALFTPAERSPVVKKFKEQYHRDPPWFIAISPTRACNLKCAGCYADSGSANTHLQWSMLKRAIDEAKALWDIKLVVFSGGEPLTYRSEGKDLLDIVESHPDLLFLMFTNGTLIDERTAERIGRLGNLTPAFSVEGMRRLTDQRRGEGVFKAVIEAMARVRKAGVPLGISVTVNHENTQEVLSDDFLKYFFEEQSAFYGFFFQYLPIGRCPSFEKMPGPAERVAFWRRLWEIVEEKRIFLIDFWNHGPLAAGCMAAGRSDGYLHIDWNGKVTPCVFVPYSAGNIHDVYRKGGTLNDIWKSPFFEAMRNWQDTYGYGQREPIKEGDWLRACPFRDHHSVFKGWVDLYKPEPEDEASGEVLADEEYARKLGEYEAELKPLFDKIWDEEYLSDR